MGCKINHILGACLPGMQVHSVPRVPRFYVILISKEKEVGTLWVKGRGLYSREKCSARNLLRPSLQSYCAEGKRFITGGVYVWEGVLDGLKGGSEG